MPREVSDYEINGNVRRELASRGLDLSHVKYRTHGGAVEVSGKLVFKDPKSPAQMVKEIYLLEGSITGIRGVKRLKMEFEEYEKTSGKWGVSDQRLEQEKKEEKEGDTEH